MKASEKRKTHGRPLEKNNNNNKQTKNSQDLYRAWCKKHLTLTARCWKSFPGVISNREPPFSDKNFAHWYVRGFASSYLIYMSDVNMLLTNVFHPVFSLTTPFDKLVKNVHEAIT